METNREHYKPLLEQYDRERGHKNAKLSWCKDIVKPLVLGDPEYKCCRFNNKAGEWEIDSCDMCRALVNDWLKREWKE